MCECKFKRFNVRTTMYNPVGDVVKNYKVLSASQAIVIERFPFKGNGTDIEVSEGDTPSKLLFATKVGKLHSFEVIVVKNGTTFRTYITVIANNMAQAVSYVSDYLPLGSYISRSTHNSPDSECVMIL